MLNLYCGLLWYCGINFVYRGGLNWKSHHNVPSMTGVDLLTLHTQSSQVSPEQQFRQLPCQGRLAIERRLLRS